MVGHKLKNYILVYVLPKSYPKCQKKDLLSTSHNAPVVKDVTQLLQCGGAERCELTLERLHIWILRYSEWTEVHED